MGVKRFFQDMAYRVGLKKTDKIMVGNVDTGEAEHINIEDIIGLFTTDDLVSGTTTKQYTTAEQSKVANIPDNTIEAIAAAILAASNALPRANHTGTQTASTISDFMQAVQNLETLTTLSLNANILKYTDEEGNETNLDLSIYLDDSNLARILNGVIDPETNIATFTRDDASTFTVDFSSLNDQAGLALKIDKTESDNRQQILLDGDSAYNIANRVRQLNGGKTVDLSILDSSINEASSAAFAWFPNSKAESILPSIIPNENSFNAPFARLSSASYYNKFGKLLLEAVNTPRSTFKLFNGERKRVIPLEPLEINRAVYSEDFSNGSWGKTGVSVVSNTSPAPKEGAFFDQIKESLNDELLTDPSFDNDTDWLHSGGWTVGGGSAIFSGSNPDTLTQSAVFKENKAYVLEIDIASVTNGSLKIQESTGVLIGTISAAGIYVYEVVASANSSLQVLRATVSAQNDFEINSISLKERVQHSIQQPTLSVAANEKTIWDVHFRKCKGAQRYLRLQLTDTSFTDGARALFDLKTGEVAYAPVVTGLGSDEESGVEYIGNGIYRAWLAVNLNGGHTSCRPYIYLQEKGGSYTAAYAGDGETCVELWAATKGDLPVLTSYIPNLSTGSTTRLYEEVQDFDLSGLIAGEFSIEINAAALFKSGFVGRISLCDDSFDNRVSLSKELDSDKIIIYMIKDGAGFAKFGYDGTDVTQLNKFLITCTEKRASLEVNDNEVAFDNTSESFDFGQLHKLKFTSAGGTAPWRGDIESIIIKNL